MTQNTFIKVNFKIIITGILIIVTLAGKSQCWNKKEAPYGFEENTSYNLDSLIVNEDTYKLLDHSIALLDTLNFNYNDTWLYYVIVLSSIYNKNDGSTQVKVELLQGNEFDFFSNRFIEEGESIRGAFCYQGYTFFVLCDMANIDLFNELFSYNRKADFHLYYKKPVLIKDWRESDYVRKNAYFYYIYLFYDYYKGEFTFISIRDNLE